LTAIAAGIKTPTYGKPPIPNFTPLALCANEIKISATVTTALLFHIWTSVLVPVADCGESRVQHKSHEPPRCGVTHLRCGRSCRDAGFSQWLATSEEFQAATD
jgi:hypothetical protein